MGEGFDCFTLPMEVFVIEKKIRFGDLKRFGQATADDPLDGSEEGPVL